MKKEKGLLIINTGDGKGKTTAALGMLMRAWGHDMRVRMYQFIKSGSADYGEYLAAKKIGLDIIPVGDGCTWKSEDLDVSRDINIKSWESIKLQIVSGKYDVIILDEFTFLFHFGWLDADTEASWIIENKPDNLHLIITGRYAPTALVEIADLVTTMQPNKHPFLDQGINGQIGIEF